MGVGSPFRVMQMLGNQTEVVVGHHGEPAECHRAPHVKMVPFTWISSAHMKKAGSLTAEGPRG